MPASPTRTDLGDWKANSESLARDAHADASRALSTAQPRRVLIVEDGIDSARSLAAVLRAMGHTVEYAINGYVALGVAKRFKPDAALLDIGLPGMDGFEVCSALKDDPETRHIRVIMLSAYGEDRHRQRAAAAGCDAHLLKPSSLEAIEEELQK